MSNEVTDIEMIKNLPATISYDSSLKEYVITNAGEPVTIRVKGQINFIFDDDVQIESNKQLDIVSNSNPICIDTVNSFLFLNSKKSKKFKKNKPFITPNYVKQVKSKITSHTPVSQIDINELHNRILILEQQFDELINKENLK